MKFRSSKISWRISKIQENYLTFNRKSALYRNGEFATTVDADSEADGKDAVLQSIEAEEDAIVGSNPIEW